MIAGSIEGPLSAQSGMAEPGRKPTVCFAAAEREKGVHCKRNRQAHRSALVEEPPRFDAVRLLNEALLSGEPAAQSLPDKAALVYAPWSAALLPDRIRGGSHG
jgi:hypothetical protein